MEHDNVTIKNGKLTTGSNNGVALNVYDSVNVVLENLTIDHTFSYTGAPLVINGSSVTLGGKVTFITGSFSWYAVNIDNKVTEGEDPPTTASLNSEPSTEVHFEGTNIYGIVVTPTKEDSTYTVSFEDNTNFYSDNEKIVYFIADESNPNVTIDRSNVKINPETEPTPEPTPTPGYDNDEDLPPFIPSQTSNDDDTVTIVACAAAAAVAAILAVFLVIDRK